MARILVADDEADVAGLILTILQQAGHRVTVVEDGERALHEVRRRGAYDLIILDVVMPEISGLDVCRAIKREGICVPVLMLTALGTGVDMMLCDDEKADAYLDKPFTKRLLLDAAERLIMK